MLTKNSPMDKKTFMQQYVLNRSRVIKVEPDIGGIIGDAERAFKLIEESCEKDKQNV